MPRERSAAGPRRRRSGRLRRRPTARRDPGAAGRGREVITRTLVCAEVARGAARTRALEATVARHDRRRGEQPSLRLIDTDFTLARQVGAILHTTRSGSDRIVDAHVVAVCIPPGGGLVVTSDPDDITALAAAAPAARIRVIHPG